METETQPAHAPTPGGPLSGLPSSWRALIEAAENVWDELHTRPAADRQTIYFANWAEFYSKTRHYLYPDDWHREEFEEPRLEDVSATSYERTVEQVKASRLRVLAANYHRLEDDLATAASAETRRSKLAQHYHKATERLLVNKPLFTDLDSMYFAPQLPRLFASRPDRAVDDPELVGAALGSLDFVEYVRERFWATEAESTPTPLDTSALPTPDAGGDTPPTPWVPLLVGMLDIEGLFSLFADCGLLTKAGELTPLGRAEGVSKARKAPWAGTLQALMKAGLLDNCAAAVCRALADPAGGVQVSLNEGTLRDYSTKAGTYLTAANRILKERGLLRK